MKKLWLIFILFCGSFVMAQNTTVTATVVDTDGTAWANGSWSINFKPNTNFPNISQYKLLNGASLDPNVTQQSGVLSNTGALSVVVYDSSLVTPTGSGWSLTVCPNSSASCGIYNFSTSGSSMDISANLTTTLPAPRFNAIAGAYGYVDIEAIITLAVGATYFNVTTQCQKLFQSGAWSCPSTAGGSISGQAVGVLPLPCGPNNICNQSALDQNVKNVSTITSSLSFVAPSLGGIKYASQLQTPYGTGNNGIFNAQDPNQMIIADPSYSLTEAPSFTSFTTTPIHYQNLRGGWTDDFYRNPQYGNRGYFATPPGAGIVTTQGAAGHNVFCQYDQDPGVGTIDTSQNCMNIVQYSLLPGINNGNPAGVSPSILWTVKTTLALTLLARTKGISEGLNNWLRCNSTGDCATTYSTAESHGGFVDTSGEGVKAQSANTFEITTPYTATCVTGCTNGSTNLKLNVANGEQGTGRPAINTTAGPTSTGKFTAVANSTLIGGGAMFAVTVDQTVPVSTAWGTLVSAVNSPSLPAPPFTTNMTFNVTLSGSSPGNFTTNTLVCFQGTFHEFAKPTAVGTPSGGVQSITVPLRMVHVAGSVIMQGGMCGNGIEFTGLTFGSVKYLWDVIGSTDANTLQVAGFQAGGNNTLLANTYTTQLLVSYTLTTATVSYGTTVYVTTSGGTQAYPYQGANFVFTGLSDSALNATCTNMQVIDATHWTCTIAGLTGTHTTSTTGIAMLGINGYNTYAMAEVTDVRSTGTVYPITNFSITSNVVTVIAANDLNVGVVVAIAGLSTGSYLNGQQLKIISATNTQFTAAFTHANVGSTSDTGTATVNPPQADGSIGLEQNSMSIAPGNTLQELNATPARFQGSFTALGLQNPYAVYQGVGISYSGRGITNGGGITGPAALSIFNGNTNSNHYGFGGFQAAPDVINMIGAYTNAFNFQLAPAPDAALINVAQNTTQTGNRNYKNNLWTWATKAGIWSKQVNLFYGDVSEAIPRVNTIGGTVVNFIVPTFGAETLVGNLTFALMTTPTLTVTCSATGGSLADGTYAYKIQARGGSLFSAQSAEVTGTVSGGSGNGSCALSWTAVAGATTAYNIFGRISGSTAHMAALDTNAITSTYAIDKGDVTPSGGPSATVQPAIDNAGYLGALSSGTAFEAKIQAPASVAGTYIETLPETGTAGSFVDKAAGATVVGDIATFSNITGRIQDSGTLITAHPAVRTCGTTTTCSNTAQTSPRIVWGTITLTSASPSTAVVGSMTSWTSTTSFTCTVSNMTTQANSLKVVNTSTTSITITGPNTVTDVVSYICVGN